MSGVRSDSDQPVPVPVPLKGGGDGTRQIGDIWQWLGISGTGLGTSGTLRATFFYALGVSAVVTASFNTINVFTIRHDQPELGLAAPIIWEASSWITFVLFFWIPWLAYRLASPLEARPRWRLLIHIPMAVAFGLAHVAGFVWLRDFAYWLAGSRYDFGAFLPNFFYEFSKDAFGYSMTVGGFTLVEYLLRQRALVVTPGQTLTFDIRDGARLTRVRLDQVLAVASAGNYVEFVLQDGRRLLMRSPLSAMENELSPRGFLRTHRSWLVNPVQMTGLKREGSGDYTVELGEVSVPLSRRFPDALAKLKAS